EEIFGYTLDGPRIKNRSAIDSFYNELFTDQVLKSFYEGSGFANLGYWGAETPDAATASNSLVDEVLALIPGVGSRVLDVACGEGGTTHRLTGSTSPPAVTAIGISHGQLTVAKQRAPASSFLCMDAANLGFADSSFDTVLCIEAAFHFRSREGFFK